MRACTPRVQEVAQLKVKARHKNKDRWMKTGLNKFKGNRVRKKLTTKTHRPKHGTR